jgi:hypothetical protein
MNIANEAITYFRHNEVSRENIDDFSLYLNGMGYIDYKVFGGAKLYEDRKEETTYPQDLGGIIKYFS